MVNHQNNNLEVHNINSNKNPLNQTRVALYKNLEATKSLVNQFIEVKNTINIDKEIQQEIASSIVLLQRIEKLIIKTDTRFAWHKLTRLRELNALICEVRSALISLFQDKPDLEIAKQVRVDTESVVYRYEYAWFGVGHLINLFLYVYRSNSVQLKVLSGLKISLLISLTFLAGCLATFYYKPVSKIDESIEKQEELINKTTTALLERISDVSQKSISELRIRSGLTASSQNEIATDAVKMALATEDPWATSLAKNLQKQLDILIILREQRALDISNSQIIMMMLLVVSSGGLGSIISILTRIDKINSFPNQDPNYQQEADPLLPIFLGAFKPVIGASFGLLIFALINSGIVTIPAIQNEDNRQREFFFCSIAFIVGFSERLAKDIITKAENALSSGGNLPPSPELVTDLAKMKANLHELESRLKNNNGTPETITVDTQIVESVSKPNGNV